MSLFRRSTLHSEPEPAPAPTPQPDALATAITAEATAAAQVRETSARCAALDEEHKSWSQRRDAAYRDFCEALARHADAKAELARSADAA